MKKLYYEFYKPANKDFEKMWKEGIFIFDSSVLLNIYEYSEETSNVLMKLIESLNDRIWLPHQVGLEFFREREKVILRQKFSYDSICIALEGSMKAFSDTYHKSNLQRTHRYFDKMAVLKKVENKIASLKKDILALKKNHPTWEETDEILNKITKLFDDNKHGLPFTEEEYTDLYKQADKKYAIECPPGYMDMNKDKDDKTKLQKYGDFIIWNQIINFAKKVQKPIIFITDDVKEDWWKFKDKISKTIIGPRDELIREIYDKASVRFYMYQTNSFITHAGEYFGIDISDSTVEEIKQISIDIKEVLVGDNAVVGPAVIGPGAISENYNSVEKNIGDVISGKNTEKKIQNKQIKK